MSFSLPITIEPEDDGRWIADIECLPGVTAYGRTEAEAITNVQALALHSLAFAVASADTLSEAQESAINLLFPVVPQAVRPMHYSEEMDFHGPLTDSLIEGIVIHFAEQRCQAVVQIAVSPQDLVAYQQFLYNPNLKLWRQAGAVTKKGISGTYDIVGDVWLRTGVVRVTSKDM